MRSRQSHLSDLLIWAVLADVSLRGAPDADLVCLPGSELLPANPRSTFLGFAIQKKHATCPALTQCCMFATHTAVHTQHLHSARPCTALAGQTYMHGTEMHSAACTALTWCYMPSTYSVLHVHHSDSSAYTAPVQNYAVHSTRGTELHAQQLQGQHCMYSQHCMHSTTCTALHAQHCLDSTSCSALHALHYMHRPAWTALYALYWLLD